MSDITKWNWMMEYCRKRRNPPAQSWAWDNAEKAYELMKRDQQLESGEGKQIAEIE